MSPLLLEALSVAVRAAGVDGRDREPDGCFGRTLRRPGMTRPSPSSRAATAAGSPRNSPPSSSGACSSSTRSGRPRRIPPGRGARPRRNGKGAGGRSSSRHDCPLPKAVGALVSLGGDISVAGAAPPGGWAIRPRGRSRLNASTGPALQSRSKRGGLATSSTTHPALAHWRTASCITSSTPAPGRPARTPWRTVTVAAATCVDANTASTTALVLGEEAVEWLESARPTGAHRRQTDGATVRTGGWSPRSRVTLARGEQREDALVPHPSHRNRRPGVPHRSVVLGIAPPSAGGAARGRASSWLTSTATCRCS